jgi:acid stress-induced BolA-like protein IbaG/YrbA
MIAQKLERVLRRRFPGAEVQIVTRPGELFAVVVSDHFIGRSETDRLDEVWAMLYEDFDESERYRVQFIFTYTVEEWAAVEAQHTRAAS